MDTRVLEQQVHFFEAMNDSMLFCLIVVDENCQLVYSNALAQQVFSSCIPDCLEQLPDFDCIKQTLRQNILFRDREVSNEEMKFIMNSIPFTDNAGSHYVIATYRNVANMRYYIILQALFNHMHEGVNIVDENGILTYSNPSSAAYAKAGSPAEMIGQPIKKYYPLAVLLDVIKDKKTYHSEERTDYPDRIYVTNAVPLYIDGVFKGGIATFRDVSEIMQLTSRVTQMKNTIRTMEMELNVSKNADVFHSMVGYDGSLKDTIEKAQRCIAALGGPRHCVITGETGTGKTLLARLMYQFAKRIKVIRQDAPFIEVNCAQFTNHDIAAMEIFGSERGSFTGAQDKQGLIEQANNGVFFLDEAHALGPHQAMLLKVIEDGMLRRIGGRTEKKLNVIVIAASTKDLKTTLIPELYQRLAQYQILMQPLSNRPYEEKRAMLSSFIQQYEESAKQRYELTIIIKISSAAEKILLNAVYLRNIRQFRDTIFAAIDQALPLISSVKDHAQTIIGQIDVQHLPAELLGAPTSAIIPTNNTLLLARIKQMYSQGMGARKIAKILSQEGFSIKYYQVTYILQKINRSVPNETL